MVHELADYERASESCSVTPADLETALFCEAPAVFGHVAELDGDVVGMAVWYLTFSTWEGGHGNPDDPVDRAVLETREAVFPHLGLDALMADG